MRPLPNPQRLPKRPLYVLLLLKNNVPSLMINQAKPVVSEAAKAENSKNVLDEAAKLTGGAGQAKVETVKADSGNVVDIIKGLTGLDLSNELNLGKLAN